MADDPAQNLDATISVKDAIRTISVKDAIRLKHSLNQSIKYRGMNARIEYRGMNARQIEELKRISSADWQKVRANVKTYGYRVKPFWYAAVVLLALVCYFVPALRHSLIVHILLCAAVAGKVGKAEGYNDGYFMGFGDGFEYGIEKLLGIDEKESREIHDRAIEMKIDENLIESFDREQTPPPA